MSNEMKMPRAPYLIYKQQMEQEKAMKNSKKKKKYVVHYTITLAYDMIVEAKSEDEAIDKAEDLVPVIPFERMSCEDDNLVVDGEATDDAEVTKPEHFTD